jgi:hypothetical protein
MCLTHQEETYWNVKFCPRANVKGEGREPDIFNIVWNLEDLNTQNTCLIIASRQQGLNGHTR